MFDIIKAYSCVANFLSFSLYTHVDIIHYPFALSKIDRKRILTHLLPFLFVTYLYSILERERPADCNLPARNSSSRVFPREMGGGGDVATLLVLPSRRT